MLGLPAAAQVRMQSDWNILLVGSEQIKLDQKGHILRFGGEAIPIALASEYP